MDEDHVVAVSKQIDLNKEIIEQQNKVISDGSDDVPEAKVADAVKEDVTHNETPGGSIYWEPRVQGIPLPVEGTYYDTLDEAIDMYTKYAEIEKVFPKADEVAKCNYKEFGDIVSFDATFNSNKYNMKFVPFIGIDNHGKCVTLGSGMLLHEDTKSYTWLLNAFMTAFLKEPTMIVTDQDGAMKRAIEAVFTKAKHRLCMWHIMQKIPSKNREINVIPKQYILRRWTRDIIPPDLRRQRNRYEEKNLTIERLTNEANVLVDDCLFLLSKDEEKMGTYVENLKKLLDEVKADMPNPPSRNTGDVIGGIF
ncbi:FAR1-related sequence 5-like protein [Tanacetum coccineum]